MVSDRLLTVAEAAGVLGVHKRTLVGWIAGGSVPVVRLGRRVVRIRHESLLHWIRENEGFDKPPDSSGGSPNGHLRPEA